MAEKKVTKKDTTNSIKKEIIKEKIGQEEQYVYVGKKGAMAYVLAVMTQFGQGAEKVIVKARGKTISCAVDVIEIVKHKELGIYVESINTITEEVQTQDGRPFKISAIEIVLTK
jgi:archaea-specific DNA-binding protein